MSAAPSFRETSRARLRESLIVAARELTVAHGWNNVRMADVARQAGVSRQTLYNEYDSRAGLAEGVAVREIHLFVTGVREQLFAHGADVRAAARAAILYALEEAERNPLVRAILTSARGGADELLPYLTTRSDVVLQAAGEVIREWAGAHGHDADAAALDIASDSIVRLAVSHIMLPRSSPPESADMLADVFARLLE
ncbi:TetR family transcriptional regulator [Actinoplanes sp. NPDC051475]|uniref:TetR/AcrR family transcriptional regulator n=1 Tax=Actinoplanes sp. NPDC051475 TaxID=3157225 RepID=UPI00344C34A3